MTQPFTPEQSQDIDDRRAANLAASAIEEMVRSNDRAARLEAIAEQALALTERALALASGGAARLAEQLQRANLAPLPPEDSAPSSGELTTFDEARRMTEAADDALVAAGATPTIRRAVAAIRYSADPLDPFRRLPRTDDEIAHELSRAADALRSRPRNAPSAGAAS